MLSGNKRSASGRTALLGVVVGEQCAFVGDAVNVGCSTSHHAAVVGAKIPDADVIAHNDNDIWFFALRLNRSGCPKKRHRSSKHGGESAANQVAWFHDFFLNGLLLFVSAHR